MDLSIPSKTTLDLFSPSLPITLVTGATGHVGANLIRFLVNRGEEKVRVLVRKQSPCLAALKGVNVEIVYGDLLDRKSIQKALKGCTYLYHTAAFVSIRYGDRENLFRVNIESTKWIMEDALSEGIKRVVYTSSFGAIRCVAPKASTEDSTFSPYEETTDYECSKGFAESEVLRVCAQGLDVVIVNPSGIVGPYDFRPSMLGKTILDFCRGNLKVYPADAAFDFVAMADVIQGHILAMKKGRTGHRYLLTGHVVTFDQWMDILEKLSGIKKPMFRISPSILSTVAYFKDWIERTYFPNSIPRFTQNSIRLLTSGKHGDRTKATKELGLEFTDIPLSIERQLAWFVSTGILPKSVFKPTGRDLGPESKKYYLSKPSIPKL